ncbi:uncharacterized protein LOC113360643 [Papaver somniferum]|uniref:uncharacterized protein LOC113360643 n=1 Tax=Papaver somniferum TaxID=3469 RepID=UPI000E6F6CB0|nr:uncharacterized protein LOC113360643 [Papaver somniferum]
METKAMKSVDKEVMRCFLIEKLLPAIKKKWPFNNCKKIFIQQDNAKPHVHENDKKFMGAVKSYGLDIELLCQPPNSPDLNVLDLGFFSAISALHHTDAPTTVDEFIASVTRAFENFSVKDANNVFITLQSCMKEILRIKGGIHYKIPHMHKWRLIRDGQLPNVLDCDPQVLNEAWEFMKEYEITQESSSVLDPMKANQMKANTKRKRTGQLAMDFKQTIIGNDLYQSWIDDASDLVGRKKRAKSINKMKIAQLMDLPPVAIVCGLAGKHCTGIYYPKPLLDLYRDLLPKPPEPVVPLIPIEENNGFGAQWLRPLLEANYFIPCRDHGEEMSKSESKYFCLDCMGKSICSYCLIHHREHRIVQIRRSNYHNVIRVNEVQKHVDISGVQHYVINNTEIVFLNERPQLRHGKRVTNTCEICGRTLLGSFRFCSLSCKAKKMMHVVEKAMESVEKLSKAMM